MSRRSDGEARSPATIGRRRDDASRRRFVGRTAEIGFVRAALAADEPPFSVLYVHGPGGVGKTALLGALADAAGSVGVPSVRLDLRTVGGSPAMLLDAFAGSLGWERAEATEESLAACGRLVVLVDDVDSAGPLEGWLRDAFVANLPARVLVVLAGRAAPSPDWLTGPGWGEVTRVVSLRNLAPAEAGEYLAGRRIDDRWHERLIALTHGHPLALSLVADVLDQRGGGARVPTDLMDAPDVVRMLMGRFVDELPDGAHREALAVCAHAQFTTEDLLRSAVPGADAGALFDWLRSRAFVEETRYGLVPHDLARDVLDTDLRWRDRTGYEDLHHRVRGHVVARLRATEGLDQQRAMADLVYLHRRNPIMARLYDWSRLGDAYVDRCRDGDRAAVVDMTARHQGRTQAALVEHWLDRQPHAFAVFRRSASDVVGFATLLRLDRASPADLDADPGARAMWRWVEDHDPPRPGEAVTAARFVVDRDVDQASPSPTWAGFTVAHALLVLGGGTAWDLIGAFRSPDVEPVLTYIDYRRVPDADFGVDGARHLVFAHDWRRIGPEAWLDAMSRREIDHDADTATVPPPLADDAAGGAILARPEFADAVRAALRDRHRADRLAANPLARSRAAHERGAGGDSGGGVPAAEAVAALLDEAAASLADDPRDAKAHRAVDRTFLRPAGTQERAAELLDMPFSTYRRHLGRGVDRIVERLWDLEVRGRR